MKRQLIAGLVIPLGLLAGSPVSVTGQSMPPSVASTDFAPAFRYEVPALMNPTAIDTTSDIVAIAEGTATAHDITPADVQAAGARGIVVMNVSDVLTHPCRIASVSSRVDLADAPASFLDDLVGIAGLQLSERSDMMLDGRPALAAMADGSECDFADLHGGGGTISSAWVALDMPALIIVADVDGATVMVQAWAATDDDLEVWLPVAREFIDSIHFVDEARARSSPALPSSGIT